MLVVIAANWILMSGLVTPFAAHRFRVFGRDLADGAGDIARV
ncbi:hypothetical protein [Mesorhizobium sp. M0293]